MPRRAAPPADVTVSLVADLRVGDVITEIDTPDGPWYEVVNVTLTDVTFASRQPGEDEDLHVTISTYPRGHVLRRPR